MKIIIAEKSARCYWKHIHITPSLSIDFASGLIDNFDINKIQNTIEIDVYFSFISLNLFVTFIVMWGDEGPIQERDF